MGLYAWCECMYVFKRFCFCGTQKMNWFAYFELHIANVNIVVALQSNFEVGKTSFFLLKISKPINIFSVDSKCESNPVGFWLEKCFVPKIDFVCATRYKSMLYFHKKFGDLAFPYWVFGSVFLFIIWTILYFLDEFIVFSEKWGIGTGSQCDKL